MESYVNKTFANNNIATIGMDIRMKRLEINNNDINISIIDTAGKERFRSITKSFYKGADGFLILFNLTRKKIFEQINYWINQIEINKNKEYPINSVLVGTLCEQKENIEVKEEDIKIIIEKYNIKYFKASAKDGTNVDAVFEYLTKITLKSRGLFNKLGLDDDTPLDKIKIINFENNKNQKKKNIDKLKNETKDEKKSNIKEKANGNKMEFEQLNKYLDF